MNKQMESRTADPRSTKKYNTLYHDDNPIKSASYVLTDGFIRSFYIIPWPYRVLISPIIIESEWSMQAATSFQPHMKI